MIDKIFSNYILNVAVLSWFIAQALKPVISYFLTNKFSFERFIGAGGMPSSHSALVCSTTMAVARQVGFSSPLFALSFILAGIVMYDAMGVRRAAGEQAKVINKIVFNWNLLGPNDPEEEEENEDQIKQLKEFIGHTPLEVLGGALLGITIAMVFPVPAA